MHQARPNNPKHRAEQGFTLIELMISIAILSVGVMALMSMQMTGIESNAQARKISESTVMGSDRLENLMCLPFDDPLLTAGDHVPDDQGPEDPYQIAWTVTDGDADAATPLPGTKLVEVTVTPNLGKTMVLRFTISDTI
jgi:type IV pilus assembly protein PilV